MADVTLYLGIGSLVAFLLSIILGLIIASMGIFNLFFIATALGVGAIVCGLMASRKHYDEGSLEQKYIRFGIMLGISVIVIVVIVQLIAYIFFTRMFKG